MCVCVLCCFAAGPWVRCVPCTAIHQNTPTPRPTNTLQWALVQGLGACSCGRVCLCLCLCMCVYRRGWVSVPRQAAALTCTQHRTHTENTGPGKVRRVCMRCVAVCACVCMRVLRMSDNACLFTVRATDSHTWCACVCVCVCVYMCPLTGSQMMPS